VTLSEDHKFIRVLPPHHAFGCLPVPLIFSFPLESFSLEIFIYYEPSRGVVYVRSGSPLRSIVTTLPVPLSIVFVLTEMGFPRF